MCVVRRTDYCCVGAVRGGEEQGDRGVVGCLEGGSKGRAVGSGVYEGDEGGTRVGENGLGMSGPDEAAAYDCYVEF